MKSAFEGENNTATLSQLEDIHLSPAKDTYPLSIIIGYEWRLVATHEQGYSLQRRGHGFKWPFATGPSSILLPLTFLSLCHCRAVEAKKAKKKTYKILGLTPIFKFNFRL